MTGLKTGLSEEAQRVLEYLYDKSNHGDCADRTLGAVYRRLRLSRHVAQRALAELENTRLIQKDHDCYNLTYNGESIFKELRLQSILDEDDHYVTILCGVFGIREEDVRVLRVRDGSIKIEIEIPPEVNNRFRVLFALSNFANGIKRPKRINHNEGSISIVLGGREVIVAYLFQPESNSCEFSATLGTVSSTQEMTQILRRGAGKDLSLELHGNQLVLLGSHEGLENATEKEIRRKIMEDIAHLDTFYEQIKNLLD